MSMWKLVVDDYGKIGHAEIEIAPLTLFVGDNNSGKSYLLSLLWGIRNIGISNILKRSELETKETTLLIDWMHKQIETVLKEGQQEILIDEVSSELSVVLNDGLKKYKNELTKWIFNSDSVNLGQIKIELKDLKEYRLFFDVISLEENTEKALMIKRYPKEGFQEGFQKQTIGSFIKSSETIDDNICWNYILMFYSLLLGIKVNMDYYDTSNIFLPAARTGFMLTKDIINRVGRENTFNLYQKEKEITPFTRPINQFLTVMGELSSENVSEEKYREIEIMMEEEMAEGTMEISSMPSREIQYIPSGKKTGMPLRIVSAVVTELSPLMLILKHKRNINSFFYEEPEMCLHPQLQQKMGKLLVRIVNAGIGVTATTHSDIILQHINNMIKLKAHSNREKICEKMGYDDSKDLLSPNQVKVYQLTAGEKTEVKELSCGLNGFEVPTFNDALDKIMDEAYEIQE